VLRHALRGVLHACLLVALVACGPAGSAREAPIRDQTAEIALAELPPAARDTLALVKKGGPFPYRKDGTTFRNREGKLPPQPRGYYSEYTVRTPWEHDRGARRIVAGRGTTGSPPAAASITTDVLQSFRRIRE
jgi:guanyl-specific ribonuclease Sa